nr:hypothetical protein [Cylindrotheca closterium]
MGVCRLSIDYNRSFKYLAAYDIKNYIEKFNTEPSVLMIDAPRDEETRFLHEIYGTLEELNNGRVDSTFYGRFKRLRFKSPHIIVFTNNVPNMSALSSDKFNLFALADKDHDYTIVKCEVNLKIETYSKSLVTWYYKARVSSDQDQQDFYEKILNANMTKIVMSALVNEDGHINEQQFDGNKRTRTHGRAPEPVQQLLNKILSIQY